MKTYCNDQIHSDITVAYLTSLFNEFRREYPEYYIMLEHTSHDIFSIHLLYDHRKKLWAEYVGGGFKEPLCRFTVHEFLANSENFHLNDKFAVSFENGSCYIENQFDADIVYILMQQTLIFDCRMAMHQDRGQYLLDTLVDKYGFSSEEIEDLGGILTATCKQIREDLQCQYNHLSKLSFIDKKIRG